MAAWVAAHRRCCCTQVLLTTQTNVYVADVTSTTTAVAAARVASYVSSKAGNDTLTSHVAEVMAKKTASEVGGGDFDAPRSNITGFTGRCRAGRVLAYRGWRGEHFAAASHAIRAVVPSAAGVQTFMGAAVSCDCVAFAAAALLLCRRLPRGPDWRRRHRQRPPADGRSAGGRQRVFQAAGNTPAQQVRMFVCSVLLFRDCLSAFLCMTLL